MRRYGYERNGRGWRCRHFFRVSLREMDTKEQNGAAYVRTSVMISQDTNAALRKLAKQGDRKFSDEVRRALRDHVERELGAAA